MSSNLESSAVATGLEKVSFHSNPKEGQCHRMFQLLDNCAHLTGQQNNAQNPSNQALTVHEPRTSRCTSWVQKHLRNQRSNCQHLLGHRESNGEGNGTPLQYFCLENPMDGGAWWAAVHEVTKSRTRLKRLSSSSIHFEEIKLSLLVGIVYLENVNGSI